MSAIRLSNRLVWVALGLVTFFVIPFVIWGRSVGAVFTPEGALAWLQGFGPVGPIAAILLLVSDLLLPIPATVVMTALGMLYGPVLGGAIGAAGSFLSGLAAYIVCVALGRPAAEYYVSDDELRRGEAFFLRWGGWMVALSRWLPILPEAVASMAGILNMPLRTLAGALACGAVPLGFVFAIVGHLGADRPGLTLALSALIPAVLWLALRPWLGRSKRSGVSG